MSLDTTAPESLMSTIKSINGFEALNRLEKQIAVAIKEGRVAFLTGAGISMGRSTFAPSWLDMMQSILAEISKITEGHCHSYIYDKTHFESRLGMFFNEHVLQMLGEYLGNDAPVDVVTQALPKNHSSIHKFLVLCAMLHGCPILTTNFDDLERAAFWEAKGLMDTKTEEDFERAILFLHGTQNQPGTLNLPDTLKIRTNQVFKPLSNDQADRLKAMLQGRILIVLGYNGQDDFDVMPYLFRKNDHDGHTAIIWVVHNGCHNPHAVPVLNDPDHTKDSRLNFLHVADTDLFLQGIYKCLVEMREKNDVDPRSWLPEKWVDSCPEENRDYWKKEIATWGKTWRHDKRDEMLKLWGAILEKMRLYNVQIGYCRRNLAIESQQMIRKQSDSGLDKLAAEIKIVEMKRVSNSATEEDFKRIKAKLEHLMIEHGSTATRRLQRDFAYKYGKWLQNQRRYDESARYLEDAIKIADKIAIKTADETVDKYDFSEKSDCLFQKFMMSWQAYKYNCSEFSEFIEAYWENDSKLLNELFKDLDAHASFFFQEDDFEHYANTKHNAAFVKQTCGEYHLKEAHATDDKASHFIAAANNWACAVQINLEGKRFRLRLRDPRKRAQSNIRIIECTLKQIRAYNDLISLGDSWIKYGVKLKGLVDSAFSGEPLPESCVALLDEVCDIYEELPQEKMRYDDVTGIFEEIESIRSLPCVNPIPISEDVSERLKTCETRISKCRSTGN